MTVAKYDKFADVKETDEDVQRIKAVSIGNHPDQLVRLAARIAAHYRDRSAHFDYDVRISDLGAIVVTATASGYLKEYLKNVER